MQNIRNSVRRLSLATATSLTVGALLVAGKANAGVEACGDVRVEGDADCRLHLGKTCTKHCEPASYNTTCSSTLYRSCSNECTVTEETVCVDSCSEFCAEDCNLGLDVICQHNCFPECVGDCDELCEDAEDPAFCKASCEANCDGECTEKCSDLPLDTSCYKHCEECCSGTCRAKSSMSCQILCQQTEIEDCTTVKQQECETGCEEGGGLFCDGQFLLAGEGMSACVEALEGLNIDVEGWGDRLGLSEEQQGNVEEAVLGEDGVVDKAEDLVKLSEDGLQIGSTEKTTTDTSTTETTHTRTERSQTTDENGNVVERPESGGGGCTVLPYQRDGQWYPWLFALVACTLPIGRRKSGRSQR